VTYVVRVTPLAWQEIEVSYRWLVERSQTAADRWKGKMEAAIFSLAEAPHRHPEAVEAEKVGFDLRQMLVGRRNATFRILFEIVGNTVRVLRVRHNKQDLLDAGNV
jgi:plasmid stabilization system protein ParE